MSDRQLMVDLDSISCLVSGISARAYADAAKRSIPIMEPYEHYLLLYQQIKNRAPGFTHPRLYAVLRALFGESSTLYDAYKSSFSYPFRLQIYRTDKIVDYLLNVTDYKGGIRFDFHKIISGLEEPAHARGMQALREPIEDDFSRDEMSQFMTAFMLSLAAESDAIVEANIDAFCRSLDACQILYGFRDRQFFLDRYPDADAYEAAKTAILRRGDAPFNAVKANR